MQLRSILLATTLFACAGTDSDTKCRTHSEIIGGAADTPSAISAAEARAVGAIVQNNRRAFCTGTLVGDRLVLTAAHCVLANGEDWLDGKPPQAISPVGISFAIGRDALAPECSIAAASIDIHQGAAVRTAPATANLRDFAIITLARGVSTACPNTAPLAIALDAFPDLSATPIFEGGFGGTTADMTAPANTIRHWAEYAGARVSADEIVAQFRGTGSPWFGDSGSALLARLADGSLRVVGVVSNFDNTGSARASRTDSERAWFTPFVTGAAACGDFGDGACVDRVVVSCTTTGLVGYDCGDGATCVVKDSGPGCEPLDTCD